MIADENQQCCTEAIQHIQAARGRRRKEEAQGEEEAEQVRVGSFTLPTINFDAQRYVDIMDWVAEEVTEPPLLRDLSDAELQEITAAPLKVPAYPVH